MAWMIGIDEAGYGPNLGPLVVAASAWWVEEERLEARGQRLGEKNSTSTAVLAAVGRPRSSTTCLYKRLSKIVSRAASERKLAIADSKQLYKPGLGLRQLERAVLVALRACQSGEPSASAPGEETEGTSPPARCARWSSLLSRHAHALPCFSDYDCDLPIDATHQEIEKLSSRFHAACALAGVKLANVRVRLVYPQEFNELTCKYGNKAGALSHVSIGLLRDTINHLISSRQHPAPSPIRITCDKHGGRNRYGAILQHHFPEEWIDTLAESGPASRYSWGPSESRTELCFRVGGEEELPVALASMTAKYHRELAMRAFNSFWCSRVPELRPTAGYPGDALRFKRAIAKLQKELAIDDDLLWRRR